MMKFILNGKSLGPRRIAKLSPADLLRAFAQTTEWCKADGNSGEDIDWFLLKSAKAAGEFVPKDVKRAPAKASLVEKVLEVGDRLKDGTVCIAVNLKKNKALFALPGIFGGETNFNQQHEIAAQLNKWNAHGHDDWRNITDAEGSTLSKVWNKVAPKELQGDAAPWFWLASPYGDDLYFGRVRRGGASDWDYDFRNDSLPVPVVRSGPARS